MTVPIFFLLLITIIKLTTIIIKCIKNHLLNIKFNFRVFVGCFKNCKHEMVKQNFKSGAWCFPVY